MAKQRKPKGRSQRKPKRQSTTGRKKRAVRKRKPSKAQGFGDKISSAVDIVRGAAADMNKLGRKRARGVGIDEG